MQLLRRAYSVSRLYTEPSKQFVYSNQTTVIIAQGFQPSILRLATSFTFRLTNAVKPQRVEYQTYLLDISQDGSQIYVNANSGFFCPYMQFVHIGGS